MVKLSDYKLKKLLKYFCADIEASKTSYLIRINRNTVNKYYNLFRKLIFDNQIKELRKFTGEVELDESYFGPRRVKGRSTRRGRGTHRQPVFGIYERNGRVYTEVIPNCSIRTLREVIRGKIDLQSTVYSDSWSGYTGLVDVGFDKHYRINHKKNEFSNKRGVHINGIESFWSFTKRRLAKFNGVKMNFNVHLKECEWRWNKSIPVLENELLMLLKTNHLV
jgi:transposase